MKKDKLNAAVEAALFMANEPISAENIAKLIGGNIEDVKIALQEIKTGFEKAEHGMCIIETDAGFQLRVKPEYAHAVRKLTPYRDLSRGLLRVLALVAYKQPITQSQIVKVIGNRAYEYVKKLTERGLIRTEKHGHTKALLPTKEFANYFGVESPEELKKFLGEHGDVKSDEKGD